MADKKKTQPTPKAGFELKPKKPISDNFLKTVKPKGGQKSGSSVETSGRIAGSLVPSHPKRKVHEMDHDSFSINVLKYLEKLLSEKKVPVFVDKENFDDVRVFLTKHPRYTPHSLFAQIGYFCAAKISKFVHGAMLYSAISLLCGDKIHPIRFDSRHGCFTSDGRDGAQMVCKVLRAISIGVVR